MVLLELLTLSLHVDRVLSGLIVGPVELIRIRLQTQPVNAKLYNGPIDCIRKIYQAGGFKSLYRGMGPTIGREGHGMGFDWVEILSDN